MFEPVRGPSIPLATLSTPGSDAGSSEAEPGLLAAQPPESAAQDSAIAHVINGARSTLLQLAPAKWRGRTSAQTTDKDAVYHAMRWLTGTQTVLLTTAMHASILGVTVEPLLENSNEPWAVAGLLVGTLGGSLGLALLAIRAQTKKEKLGQLYKELCTA